MSVQCYCMHKKKWRTNKMESWRKMPEMNVNLYTLQANWDVFDDLQKVQTHMWHPFSRPAEQTNCTFFEDLFCSFIFTIHWYFFSSTMGFTYPNDGHIARCIKIWQDKSTYNAMRAACKQMQQIWHHLGANVRTPSMKLNEEGGDDLAMFVAWTHLVYNMQL